MPAEGYQSFRENTDFSGALGDFCRIRWCLKSTISASISVLWDPIWPNAPFTLETYQSESGDYIHPISKLPITTPPCSSVEVSLGVLDNYPEDWVDAHIKGAVPGEPGVRFERRPEEPEDDDHPGDLVHCCGEDKPSPGPILKVEAKPGDFITIGCFIAIVHPWLRSIDNQIRVAKGLYNDEPLPQEIDLFLMPFKFGRRMRIATGKRLLSGGSFQWTGGGWEWNGIAKAIQKFRPLSKAQNASQNPGVFG